MTEVPRFFENVMCRVVKLAERSRDETTQPGAGGCERFLHKRGYGQRREGLLKEQLYFDRCFLLLPCGAEAFPRT